MIAGFIVFFVLVILSFSIMNWFFYTRLVNGLTLDPNSRKIVFWTMLILSLAFFLGQLMMRLLHFRLQLLIGSIWLGILAMGVSVFFLEWLFSALYPQGRRTFTIIALLILFAATVFSLHRGTGLPQVREMNLTMPSLPLEHSPFVIVQLSDLHLGYLVSLARLERIVEKCNELGADIVVITGDLVDGDPERLIDFSSVLSGLHSRHGVFLVTGNHEFYSGIERVAAMAEQAGITLLRNERRIVAGAVELIGLDDDSGRRMSGAGPAGEKLFREETPGLPRILLYHRPQSFNRHAAWGVDLQLSGHTHAGQLPPLDLFVFLTFKYHYGLFEKNDSRIYTSSGTGTWGPPMRLFSSNEIARFILKSGN